MGSMVPISLQRYCCLPPQCKSSWLHATNSLKSGTIREVSGSEWVAGRDVLKKKRQTSNVKNQSFLILGMFTKIN